MSRVLCHLNGASASAVAAKHAGTGSGGREAARGHVVTTTPCNFRIGLGVDVTSEPNVERARDVAARTRKPAE